MRFITTTTSQILPATISLPSNTSKTLLKPRHHNHTDRVSTTSSLSTYQIPPFPINTLVIENGSLPHNAIETEKRILKTIGTICELPLTLGALFLAGVILYGCLIGELFSSIEDRKYLEYDDVEAN